MHSLRESIRICHLERVMSTLASPRWTSLSRIDIHLGEHHFLGLTNPDVNQKRDASIGLLCDFSGCFICRTKIDCGQVD